MHPETSVNNKRIAKNTFLLYFRMLLTMTVSLYTSRIVLSTLGVDDYGIYNVVGGIVTMFAFINSAMANASQRFLTFELGKCDCNKLHKVFCTSVAIHAVISLIILLMAETVGLWFLNTYMVIPIERMNAAKWVYQFAVFSTIVVIMRVPFNASIIAHEKMSVFAYISILEVILKLTIVYLLLLFNIDKLKLYAVLIFCIQLMDFSIYITYCYRHFAECHYYFYYNKHLFNEMICFAGWSMFGNLAAVAYTQGVNILLNVSFGPIVNAARAVAVQVQNAVKVFVSNFQMALNPQITKYYASGNLEQMHILILASSRYSFFLLFFLSLPIIIEAEQILSIWLEEVPGHTVNFIRLILCIMMVDAIANPLVIAAQATGRIKVYQAVVGGVLLLIVPLSYIALKLKSNPEVVFVVHFIMVIVAHITRLIMIRSMIHLSLRRYFMEVIVKIVNVVLMAVLLPMVVYYVMPLHSFISFIIVCGICVFSVLISVYLLGLGKTERTFVLMKITEIKNKIINR